MKFLNAIILVLILVVSLLACRQEDTGGKSNQPVKMSSLVQKEAWGKLADGSPVDRYTLTNKHGLVAQITNYGGIVVSLMTPDRNGKLGDVVLGYETLDEYVKDNPYFGCIVGRFGNRIANGQFEMDGKTYKLAKNDGENHLHGGLKGFDKVVWEAIPDTSKGEASLNLTYVSPDMEEGYPGNLEVRVVYTLTHNNELKITYFATPDKKTHVNLTHHSYFNLTGNAQRDILDHVLSITSNGFLPVDASLIPMGTLTSLNGSPFDFRKPKRIGLDINAEHEQLKIGHGYDHCWLLSSIKTGNMKNPAATVYEPISGRFMEVYTTDPGIQFYSGNFLDGKYKGKGGVVYQDRWGFCLETQHFPDTPNRSQNEWPSTVVMPGSHYSSTTIYKFAVK
ncbi:MAG: galactose mutarotase [Saprospiraceae bacterium]|nr:galactose mutarotase [Saprospiraceae bacterium]